MKYVIIILIVAASFLVWQQAQAKPKNTPGPQPEPEKKPAPPLFVAPLVEQPAPVGKEEYLPPVFVAPPAPPPPPAPAPTPTNYEGKPIKGSGPEVYVVKSNTRIYIPSEFALNTLGFLWRDVLTVSDSTLNSIPLYAEPKTVEEPNPATKYNSKAIKGSAPSVYYVKDGVKTYVPNEATLRSYGYGFGDVITVNDSVLNQIPNAPAPSYSAPQYIEPVAFQSPIVREPVRFNDTAYESPFGVMKEMFQEEA